MDFYHGLFQVQGITLLLILILAAILPLICIIHCLLSARKVQAKILWIAALLLTLIFAATAYLLIHARRHKWMAWLISVFFLLVVFSVSFHGVLSWYIIKDARIQTSRANQTLETLKTPELSFQDRNHAFTFIHFAIAIAQAFQGNYSDAPPVAKEALIESLTFLRTFNVATNDGELSLAEYKAIIPATQQNILLGKPQVLRQKVS
ncbi:MAG: hypothetical protein K0R12_730 [Gammaproteobacteria bacterium]|jgi:hypothetical protein|nr:hypothetical protein [Gammaproteobacteria bacterium]